MDRKQEFTGCYWSPNLKRAFRYFYLMAGLYQKTAFADWFASQDRFPARDADRTALQHPVRP
jgi:hypothetical protein